ncbi:WecB/TagA/CpsF family glycosyltransferase [Shewanella eurypsychrophilus]|uniref:WecB/TagA/CpsF family glycosyltransferase n=1 Tax=Shewanella eurypsychrophilus TaxID=2593656 RepID=A0ABX6VA04_9GAMM|nr:MULTISPECIES: WecB/TagA/CpsF family glycosyltransferase [Shewanella]QFU23435.1 glycosyltransferase [Shewanella sp. YLB-09]QPG58663.1 WecB/TagA/CpsF family glycosyltransferase [Shewanella eurypsychrophilus]
MMHPIINKVIQAPEINESFTRSMDCSLENMSQPKLISFVNPYSYMILKDNFACYEQVDVFYSDAIVSSLTFSLIANKRVPRVSFDYGSFGKTFLETLNQSRAAVYFIGAKPNEIAKTMALFQQEYPNLNVVGYRDGYFSDDAETLNAIKTIIETGAEYVVCGMGTPYQEHFGAQLKAHSFGGIKEIYTCGGFLHQSSEGVQYYPDLINQLHLRWLYRIFNDKYVIKRLLNQYPRFLFSLAYDSIVSVFKRK